MGPYLEPIMIEIEVERAPCGLQTVVEDGWEIIHRMGRGHHGIHTIPHVCIVELVCEGKDEAVCMSTKDSRCVGSKAPYDLPTWITPEHSGAVGSSLPPILRLHSTQRLTAATFVVSTAPPPPRSSASQLRWRP